MGRELVPPADGRRQTIAPESNDSDPVVAQRFAENCQQRGLSRSRRTEQHKAVALACPQLARQLLEFGPCNRLAARQGSRPPQRLRGGPCQGAFVSSWIASATRSRLHRSELADYVGDEVF